MTSEPLRLPVPINEAEAMIDTFWDEKIANINDYTLNRDTAASIPAACNPRSSQYWCWDMLKWDHAPVGRPIVTLDRAMNVGIEGYDRLMVRLAIPAHVTLSVRAVIDGQSVVLIVDQPGQAGPFEYEAPMSGMRLEGLTLALTSLRDQGDEGWLYWIGVANEARRAAMLARPTPFTARWEPFLLPPQARPEFTPRFGFFFDAGELPAIRRRAKSPAYSRLMAQMRQSVHEIMAFHKSPEEQVGPNLGAGMAWAIQARTRDWDTYPFYAMAPLVAFVGLMDEDAEMLRFAARIAVSVAHCRTWAPHFMQDFPGSTWDTRAFPESHAAAGVAMALDWAGGWFSDAGEHLIRYAITHKAMGRMRGIFLQYDYMWDCNQTHLIALGRLLGLLVQLGNANPATMPTGKNSAAQAGRTPETKRGWERARVDIEQFERDLAEMIDRYVQPDGSSNEGVGYWGATFRSTLPVLAALARYRGKKLTDMVAPKLNSMWKFVAPVLSTAGEPGSYVPISDTSFNGIYWDTIGLAAAALDSPGWKGLQAACLAGKTKTVSHAVDMMPDGPFTIIYGPDQPAAPSIDVPVFHRLETAGMITSNRPWPPSPNVGGAGVGSTVRLFMVGAMPNAGHCHPPTRDHLSWKPAVRSSAATAAWRPTLTRAAAR